MQGKIIKGIAGFYYVYANAHRYECKAKGVFRKQGIKPLVGDDVCIEIVDEDKKIARITEVLTRKSVLIRPAVANVDAVLLVASIAMPNPIPQMMDYYLIGFMRQEVPVTLLWNKMDLQAEDKLSKIYEQAGFPTLRISTQTKSGMEELYAFLEGKTTVLAGPSGVGKSSLTNLLCQKASMEIGGLSKKIDRGKHTTRHSELFMVNECSFLCDTPGFTFVGLKELKKEELKSFYPEFFDGEGKCRFNGCAHINEPNCAIKQQIGWTIDKVRYENYVKMYQEIEAIRKKYH